MDLMIASWSVSSVKGFLGPAPDIFLSSSESESLPLLLRSLLFSSLTFGLVANVVIPLRLLLLVPGTSLEVWLGESLILFAN
jgi:hypothetical protein